MDNKRLYLGLLNWKWKMAKIQDGQMLQVLKLSDVQLKFTFQTGGEILTMHRSLRRLPWIHSRHGNQVMVKLEQHQLMAKVMTIGPNLTMFQSPKPMTIQMDGQTLISLLP